MTLSYRFRCVSLCRCYEKRPTSHQRYKITNLMLSVITNLSITVSRKKKKELKSERVSLKSKNKGPLLIKWLFYRTETINKMCLVANGQDRNGLQLEIFWQIFSSFCSCVWDKIGKDYFFYFVSLEVRKLFMHEQCSPV